MEPVPTLQDELVKYDSADVEIRFLFLLLLFAQCDEISQHIPLQLFLLVLTVLSSNVHVLGIRAKCVLLELVKFCQSVEVPVRNV